MAVWIVRAGEGGRNADYAFERGIISIDFGLEQSVLDFVDRPTLRDHVQSQNAASQLWRFANEMQIGDMVVLPRRQPSVAGVGTITGDYSYRTDLATHGRHTRTVDWRVTDIPRASFDTDLQHALTGLLTVFQPRHPDAERRIRQLADAYLSDGSVAEAEPLPPQDDELAAVDWDEYLKSRIIEIIRVKYPGVELERLVTAVLSASGYTALQTRAGPDGGIDVVAGMGELGFSEPRLCIQVKSGRSLVDLPAYNRLQGNVRSFGADHGLLVSLSGFTRAVHNENERTFFEIRLWDADVLAQRLLDVYDNLPLEIRRDIPLESRLMPVEMTPPV